MGTKTKLRIGHLKITDHLILGVTKAKIQKGVETFQHSDIETVAMTGWNGIGEALEENSIDAAFMLAPYAMETFNDKKNIRMLMLSHKSGSVIVTNKRANIEKLEDFKGKTILIPYHLSIHHMLIDKLLTEKGLETGVGKDVVFETVAPSQIAQAIEWDEAGDIGGYIVAEPFGEQVIRKGLGKLLYLSKDIWPKHPCCVLVARDEIIEKHPEALQELVTSLVKSGKLIEEKKDTAAKIGASFLGQDIPTMTSVLNNPPDRLSTGELLPVLEDLEKIQTYLTTKISAMSSKIDLEKFAKLEFAKNAGAT